MVKSQETTFHLWERAANEAKVPLNRNFGRGRIQSLTKPKGKLGWDEINTLLTISQSHYPPVFWPLSLFQPNWKPTAQWRLVDTNSRGSLLRCADGREEQRMDLDKGPAEKSQHMSTWHTITFHHFVGHLSVPGTLLGNPEDHRTENRCPFSWCFHPP